MPLTGTVQVPTRIPAVSAGFKQLLPGDPGLPNYQLSATISLVDPLTGQKIPVASTSQLVKLGNPLSIPISFNTAGLKENRYNYWLTVKDAYGNILFDNTIRAVFLMAAAGFPPAPPAPAPTPTLPALRTITAIVPGATGAPITVTVPPTDALTLGVVQNMSQFAQWVATIKAGGQVTPTGAASPTGGSMTSDEQFLLEQIRTGLTYMQRNALVSQYQIAIPGTYGTDAYNKMFGGYLGSPPKAPSVLTVPPVPTAPAPTPPPAPVAAPAPTPTYADLIAAGWTPAQLAQYFPQLTPPAPAVPTTPSPYVDPALLAQAGIYSSTPLTLAEAQALGYGQPITAAGSTRVIAGETQVFDPIYDPVTGALVAGWHIPGTTWSWAAHAWV